MIKLPIIDNLLYNVQRQGKISFYVRKQFMVNEVTYQVNELDDCSEYIRSTPRALF